MFKICTNRRAHGLQKSHKKYEVVSFDVPSFFPNISLAKTTDMILKCVYSEKLVTTSLTKRPMKKLLKDACSKTELTVIDRIYKQIIHEPTSYLWFCPIKDRISWNRKANVMCIIQCPGCHKDYVSKTDRKLTTRLSKHGKKEGQIMLHHLWSCEEFNYRLNLYILADIFSDTRTVDHMGHLYDSVVDSCKVLTSCKN